MTGDAKSLSHPFAMVHTNSQTRPAVQFHCPGKLPGSMPCLTNWAGQAPKDAAAGRGSAGHSINMHFLKAHLLYLKMPVVFTAKRICDEVECQIDINF